MRNKVVLIFFILILGTFYAEAQEYTIQVADVSVLAKYDTDIDTIAQELFQKFKLDRYKYSVNSIITVQSERTGSRNKEILIFFDTNLKDPIYNDPFPLEYLSIIITDWSDNAIIYKEFFDLGIFPEEALIKVFPGLKDVR